MSRLAVPTVLLLLAFAAMAGPVEAKPDRLLVGSLAVDGPATQQGDLAMLFVFDSGETAASATPWISGFAGAVRTVEYATTGSEVSFQTPEPLPPTVDTVPLGEGQEQAPVETLFTAASLKLVGHQGGFQAHAFAPDGGLIPFSASSDDRAIAKVDRAYMSPQALGAEPDAASGQVGDTGPDAFSFVERPGPLAMHRGDPLHTEVVLRGTFVLEIYGLTLDVADASQQRTVASGFAKEPKADGQDNAYDYRDTFVRIFLEDAELTVAVDGAGPSVDWVSAAVDLEPSAPVTIYNGHGQIKDQILRDARYVIPAGNLYAIAPRADGLQVDVDEAGLGTSGTIADVPAPASAALVGSGAVLALLVAIGIGLLRRVLRLPQLADVERAIEEGEYRRAARLAGRILASRPDDESAVLARGIALSKAGQHQRAVRELSAHLARTAATDGSLHYVLGLAQLDLGERDAGRASLREAVRLTPSLQAEVGLRLGKAFSSPAPTTREASAYA